MVTIDDVAQRVGVARTTVSHALSGKRPVAAVTRARVLAAAAELGYQSNALARSLRERRTSIVGLSLPLDAPGRTLSHGPFSEFVATIADYLALCDYRLLCLVGHDPAAAELERLTRAGYVDGLLLLQVRLDDPRVAALRAVGLPCVAIGRTRDTTGLAWVDADLVAAGEIAVRYLAQLGHQRIAFLGARPLFGYQYHALAGFQSAHVSLNLPLDPAYILHIEQVSGLRDALTPLMTRSDGPTALITTTDLEAVMAMHVLLDHRVRVPEDVSIITLGDSVLAEMARPAITAVRFSVTAECQAAVDILLRLLSGHTIQPAGHLIPVDLAVRQSTGPLIRARL